jgi:hypothetical protein
MNNKRSVVLYLDKELAEKIRSLGFRARAIDKARIDRSAKN